MDGGLFSGAAKGMSYDVLPSRTTNIDKELVPTLSDSEYSQKKK